MKFIHMPRASLDIPSIVLPIGLLVVFCVMPSSGAIAKLIPGYKEDNRLNFFWNDILPGFPVRPGLPSMHTRPSLFFFLPFLCQWHVAEVRPKFPLPFTIALSPS